jgi:basic membrane lipoprotein Med (substrate-binding protein (PBP1-ABC) superfamily)
MIAKSLGRRAILALIGSCMLSAIPLADLHAQEAPKEVRVAIIPTTGPETAWDSSVLDALGRLDAEKPSGLKVSYDMKEAAFGDKAETVLKLLAKSGKYDIIVSAGAHSDQIEKVMNDYPDIMFVSLGSGNHSTGKNHYFYYGRVHQPAYLLGMLSAGMSKTGVLGIVGSFPAQDINDQINAMRAGAKSINPNTKMKITFIESWYDPPKATEASYAQIAAGADVLYQLVGEVYEPCQKKKAWCLSKYKDMSSLAPDVVLSGTELLWDPSLREAINTWYEHKTKGTPYAANAEPKWFSMKDGGSRMSPYHDLASAVPDDLKKKIEEAKAKIISGELEVPLSEDTPTSD